MYPDLLKIGPFTLHSFGVMAMLGFLVPTLIMRREFKRIKIDPDFASTIAVAAIIGGFVGARLYYIIEHWQGFLRDPWSMIFSGAGLVWYGGLFGGVAATAWTITHYKMPFWKVADIVSTLLLLGQAFGRMGCLLAADGDYGPPTDVPWAMSFPNGVVPTIERVHPTPIYDIAILLTFFGILWSLRKRDFVPGTMFGMYFIAVGIGRFITEFWRTTPKILFGWMTMAQIISVVLITTGLVIIYLRQRARHQQPVATATAKRQTV
jgi:phosphatidylglycerol:prolipoprotein diacylglycerol transferase